MRTKGDVSRRIFYREQLGRTEATSQVRAQATKLKHADAQTAASRKGKVQRDNFEQQAAQAREQVLWLEHTLQSEIRKKFDLETSGG